MVPPVMHARSCLSASAALPTARGERKKNADHGIKTKLEELVKLGIENHLLLP